MKRDQAPQLTAIEALGVALSVQAEQMVMGEAQARAPAMLDHLEALGYRLVPAELDVDALRAGAHELIELVGGMTPANVPPLIAQYTKRLENHLAANARDDARRRDPLT